MTIQLGDTTLEELVALEAKATQDWRLQKMGVIVGGPLKEYVGGKGQSQIAMFCGAEHINSDERNINAELATKLRNTFPAIAAKLEEQQRVIEAAKKMAAFIRVWQTTETCPEDGEEYDEIMERISSMAIDALADYDKAGEK